MKLSKELIVIGTGCSLTDAVNWSAPLAAAMEKFAINTPNRIAGFLANIGVESGGLTDLEESLNYSAQRMAIVWPSRYAVDYKAAVKVPNEKANQLANKPQALANDVYANRLGNGDVSTGDGWRYRGRCPIQLTGETAYASCGKAIGIDLVTYPAKLMDTEVGALAAAWFYSSRGCNAAADAGNFPKVVKLINGDDPCAANQGELRLARVRRVVDFLAAK